MPAMIMVSSTGRLSIMVAVRIKRLALIVSIEIFLAKSWVADVALHPALCHVALGLRNRFAGLVLLHCGLAQAGIPEVIDQGGIDRRRWHRWRDLGVEGGHLVALRACSLDVPGSPLGIGHQFSLACAHSERIGLRHQILNRGG